MDMHTSGRYVSPLQSSTPAAFWSISPFGNCIKILNLPLFFSVLTWRVLYGAGVRSRLHCSLVHLERDSGKILLLVSLPLTHSSWSFPMHLFILLFIFCIQWMVLHIKEQLSTNNPTEINTKAILTWIITLLEVSWLLCVAPVRTVAVLVSQPLVCCRAAKSGACWELASYSNKD